MGAAHNLVGVLAQARELASAIPCVIIPAVASSTQQSQWRRSCDRTWRSKGYSDDVLLWQSDVRAQGRQVSKRIGCRDDESGFGSRATG